jgi:TPR repeat protein
MKDCKRIKKELEKRGGKLDLGDEMDLGPMEKLPPQEECPICMRVLPLNQRLQTYANCCGKTLCCGCNFQHQMKSEESLTCAFCRTAVPESDEEILPRLMKRVELKDPQALFCVAMAYKNGHYGLPVDQIKCLDLMRRSAGLGTQEAQYQLETFHRFGEMGLEQNEEEAHKYLEKAAEGGFMFARHNLGIVEFRSGNEVAAMRHLRLSASAGFRTSMEPLIDCFEKGLLRHGDLAETLQAMHLSRAEMKSEDRDKYISYLKMTGKYKGDYDC